MSPISNAYDGVFHVLNFFYDDEDNCALTAIIDNARFHVIADTSMVRHGTIGQEYAKLLQTVKEDDVEGGSPLASSDSGIDVSDDHKSNSDDKDLDAEEALHRWMLSALKPEIEEDTSGRETASHLTLDQWYNLPTYFYNLEAKDKRLHAVELEPDDDLRGRIKKLEPQISIPKYIREIDVPHYKASDLAVIDCSHSPPPYHPARVQLRSDGRIFFLKVVDNGQPQPTKREISLLKKIDGMGLHQHIRCPRVEGLVYHDGHDGQILGFLQTDIKDPVPLTMKLDTEVPQNLRDRWAAEAERMKRVLHEHGLIWGDAKADNFMVDRNGDLWIIDFGGSYTEGWVDSELKETIEGDDMGVEKIANALHDPIANTWDPDTEKSYGGSSKSRKRKASEDSEPEVDTKRAKHTRTSSEDVYCYCEMPSSGDMVACDGPECEREWFHFQCVGLERGPEKDGKWYCEDCKASD